MPTHISLPNERVEQLRMLAQVKGQTISEVVAGLVRAEIEKGTISADVPGFEVSAADEEIIIRHRDGFEAKLPKSEGPTVAEVLSGSAAIAHDPEHKKRWIEGAAALVGFKVKRAGNGLKIGSPISDKEYPLNLDVAQDLGDQIERAMK